MSNDSTTLTEPASTPRRRLTRPVLAGAVVLVVVVAAVAVWASHREETVPYTDQASSGLLTLCDAQGHEVTEGKVTDKPLAQYVLGETPLDGQVAPEAVAVATLFGYQPRAGVEPLEFSGAPIGGPVAFADHAEPATEVVKDGYSIADFTEIYPATLDGYVQLRLITSADGFGAFATTYDTADLKVDGDTWKVVRGGHASCADAASLLAR